MSSPAPAAVRPKTFGDFDFGLDADAERRAQALHEGAVVVDLLTQGPCGYRSFTQAMESEVAEYLASTDDIVDRRNFVLELPVRDALASGSSEALEHCWREAGVTAATRGRDFVSTADVVKGLGIAAAQFEHFSWLVRATHPDDIRAAKRNGQVAGFVSSQESLGLGTDLELLERASDLGLAMLQLTYNSTNFVGSGCAEPVDDGLTSFGVKLVRRANDLGIVVDVSHCGVQTTFDACAAGTRPVVASHTSARGLYDHRRAKTDDQLKAIAATGGVIGVYAVPFLLAPGPEPSIEAMLDHVDYIAQLVGWDHVAIGSDWPEQMPKRALRAIYPSNMLAAVFGRDHAVDYARNLVGFDDFRDWPNITRGLVARGYEDDAIRGILGENFLRVFGEVTA